MIVERKVVSVNVAFPSTVVDPKMMRKSAAPHSRSIFSSKMGKSDC